MTSLQLCYFIADKVDGNSCYLAITTPGLLRFWDHRHRDKVSTMELTELPGPGVTMALSLRKFVVQLFEGSQRSSEAAGAIAGLVLAQTDAIEHQRTPSDRIDVIPSQLLNELASGVSPKPRNIGPFDTGGIRVDLFDAAGADARDNRLNDLCLQLLGIFGDSIAGKLDFVTGTVTGRLTNSPPDDFLAFTFVQDAARTGAGAIVIAGRWIVLGATKLGHFSGHDFTDHFPDVTSQQCDITEAGDNLGMLGFAGKSTIGIVTVSNCPWHRIGLLGFERGQAPL